MVQKNKKISSRIKFVGWLLGIFGAIIILFYLATAKDSIFYANSYERGELFILFLHYGIIILPWGFFSILASFLLLTGKRGSQIITIIGLLLILLSFWSSLVKSVMDWFPLTVIMNYNIMVIVLLFIPVIIPLFLLIFDIIFNKKETEIKSL